MVAFEPPTHARVEKSESCSSVVNIYVRDTQVLALPPFVVWMFNTVRQGTGDYCLSTIAPVEPAVTPPPMSQSLLYPSPKPTSFYPPTTQPILTDDPSPQPTSPDDPSTQPVHRCGVKYEPFSPWYCSRVMSRIVQGLTMMFFTIFRISISMIPEVFARG